MRRRKTRLLVGSSYLSSNHHRFWISFSCRVGKPKWVVYSQTTMDIRCIIQKIL